MPIYAGMEDSLAVVRRRNGAWALETKLEGKHTQCVAVDPLRPEHVLCGTLDAGLWHSRDAGETWQPAGAGIAQAMVMAVAANPLEPVGSGSVLYAGTEPSALYRSEDGGATWRELPALLDLPSKSRWSFPPRPYTSHVRQVLPRGEQVTVCIEAGALVRSLDGGETWIDRTDEGPRDTHTLRTHPQAPDRLYSAAGDGYGRTHGYAMTASGYNQSPDRGATWERPDRGLDDLYLWGLGVDPGDPEVVVVSVSRSPQLAHNPHGANSSVYRRAHGGDWAEVRDGLPEPEGCVAAVLATNPAEPGAFYAASNRGGVYRSGDAGLTWGRVPLAWPDRYERERVADLLVLP